MWPAGERPGRAMGLLRLLGRKLELIRTSERIESTYVVIRQWDRHTNRYGTMKPNLAMIHKLAASAAGRWRWLDSSLRITPMIQGRHFNERVLQYAACLRFHAPGT